MKNGRDSFEDDRKFLIAIIDNHMAEDDLLYDYFADRKLSFNSDYQIGLYLLWKFVSEMRTSFNEESKLPPVYATENREVNEDKEFAVNLFRKTILHRNEFKELVESNAANWDYGRLALMDKILIFMALTEFCDFHSIPVKVTINEYIEISKFYSTAESRRFVNGMLDKIAKQLSENGKLVKTGLGLVDK
jgi:N utilization substance protein B